MTVSVFNIVSSWLQGLKLSTEIAIKNAGSEMDYILILWNPSKEVLDYAENSGIKYSYYITDESLGFIENLRNCFNAGFEWGFELNDYTCGINTDIICAKDWLKNLVKYANPNSIINCRQIEPHNSIHEIRDFGIPGEDFDLAGFEAFANSISKDELIMEEQWGRRADATPHLIHRSLWEKTGPWIVTENPADCMWFDRAKAMGFKNMKSLGSICYHYGGVETRKQGK